MLVVALERGVSCSAEQQPALVEYQVTDRQDRKISGGSSDSFAVGKVDRCIIGTSFTVNRIGLT